MTDQAPPDIVEQLRAYIPGENDDWVATRIAEAADEIERLRALTRPPSERPVAQVWRPIESAPRDKTILVFGQPTDVEGVRFSMPFVCTAYWDDIDSSFCLSGASWLGPFIRPKFWMPLPQPPEDSRVLKKDEQSGPVSSPPTHSPPHRGI